MYGIHFNEFAPLQAATMGSMSALERQSSVRGVDTGREPWREFPPLTCSPAKIY